jgi:hypothetical protein
LPLEPSNSTFEARVGVPSATSQANGVCACTGSTSQFEEVQSTIATVWPLERPSSSASSTIDAPSIADAWPYKLDTSVGVAADSVTRSTRSRCRACPAVARIR